jgi:pimeloyl-ACP methyl ester carboxylesterase
MGELPIYNAKFVRIPQRENYFINIFNGINSTVFNELMQLINTMKKYIVLFIFTCLVFTVGMAIGYKRSFPIPMLIDIRNSLFTPQDNLTVGNLQLNEFNNLHEMPTVNSEYQYLYSELPVSYKVESTTCPNFNHFILVNKSFTCNEIKYLESGIRSYTLLLKSRIKDSKKLIIYNHGHGGLPVSTENFAIDFINMSLDNGYDILLVSMPFIGLNRKQGNILLKTFDGISEVKENTDLPHNLFEGFDLTSSSYLRFFVDDASFFLSQHRGRYSNINFVGHSGGAWTGVHVCSMFSDIINRCFLSSGVMTYDIRIANSTANIGDAEQISYTINKRHPISRELKKASERTTVTLYYNTNDVCCFNGLQPSKIKKKLETIAPKVNVIIDTNSSHSFNYIKAFNFIND